MKDWKKVVTSPSVTIREVIEQIDSSGLQIALVVDENQKLLGTVTDGDIRRGLLRQVPLTASVIDIMHEDPVVVSANESKITIRQLFDEYHFINLPVVDDKGILCGLESLHDYAQSSLLQDNPVVLMAGGFGTRLRPLTNSCPKPLLKIADKPILEIILESFISSGFHRFFISTHYMPEKFKKYFGDGRKWNVSITYVHEEEPLGTGGALGLIPHKSIDLPVIMMNGDLLTSVNFLSLLEFHDQQKGMATMCVRQYEHMIPFGVIESEGYQVKEMVEKPTYSMYVNAGIYVIEPKLVKSVKSGTKIDITTILQNVIEKGQIVSMFPIHEYWLDIGRKEDFHKAQEVIHDLNGLD